MGGGGGAAAAAEDDDDDHGGSDDVAVMMMKMIESMAGPSAASALEIRSGFRGSLFGVCGSQDPG